MDDFYRNSSIVLEEVATFFESSWNLADVDLLEGTLTVTLPHKQQYVLHKHGVTKQIWLASPFTGAHHFRLKEGQWVCTRTGVRLQDLLLAERDAYAS
jgi:frataxin